MALTFRRWAATANASKRLLMEKLSICSPPFYVGQFGYKVCALAKERIFQCSLLS